MTRDTTLLPIRKDLVAGIDVGGTKVHIMDTLSTTVWRYDTSKYDSLDDVLEEYFQTMEARPTSVVVGIAGPRDDETGEIQLTNANWPVFKPLEATKQYGIPFMTANDIVITAAGVLQESGVELLQLKPGTATTVGTKLIIAISTGIGVSAAAWDHRSQHYTLIATEGGHIGFQPKDEAEQDYLLHLLKKYPHPSAEFALSGKYGIANLVDYMLPQFKAPHLERAIKEARATNSPIATALLEFATQGEGTDREAARVILGRMGAMIGSVIRDLTVAYKATGGVYLTGSVALGLGEYFVQHTELVDRFVREGAVHDEWITRIPINLVVDPNVAAAGALMLARDM